MDKKNKRPTKAGLFLKSLKNKVAPAVLDALNLGDVARAIGLIKKDKGELTEQEQKEFLELAQMDLKDRENARKMQESALMQDDIFSKRFVYYLAAFWSIFAALYFFLVTFFKVANVRVSDTVTGFLLGTIVSTIITFFFGSSQGSKVKEQLINSLQNKGSEK